MEIQKRDCGIKIKFHDLGAGWLNMDFDIENKHFTFSSSDCCGDGLEDLINAIFQLNPTLDTCETDFNIVFKTMKHKIDGEEVDLEIPLLTDLAFNEEPSSIYWKFEREETADIDCNLKIHLSINREKTEDYDFTVRYKDFCYALAKACTEMLKEYGIIGYRKSYWRDDFPLRQFLRIKAIALNDFSCIDTIYDKNHGERSNLNKEIEFLLLDI